MSNNPWVTVGSWTHSGNISQFDFTNLAQYSEWLLLVRGITTSVAASLIALVSIDNGSSFLNASGDYKVIDGAAGGVTNAPDILFTNGDIATARTAHLHIVNPKMTIPKIAWRRNFNQTTAAVLIPTANAINALRFKPHNAATMNAGSAWLLGKL